ncbi:hypothetical protein HYPSUDRAFT_208462 [Hypholoma sublateritium FD-334 SS-4]|uniref:Uncharacterized protein n=1 Tax=Hypholoma sublateritium (strain FD-334 SS-4) TaxID=945553 RepID=A0A0D2N6L5_HYPSF|nr:hypothetical protein HYPSUDRAFT_208462 [Hypholoma sublateritium FD-334 SS-4]
MSGGTAEPKALHLFATFSRRVQHPIHGIIEQWRLETPPVTPEGQQGYVFRGARVRMRERRGVSTAPGHALTYRPHTWAGIVGDVGIITRRDWNWVEFCIVHASSADATFRVNLLVPLEWARLGFFGWVYHWCLCLRHGGRSNIPFNFTLSPPATAALEASRSRGIQLVHAPVVFRRFSDLEAQGQAYGQKMDDNLEDRED